MNKINSILSGKTLIKSVIYVGFAVFSLTFPSYAQDFNPKFDAWYFHNFQTDTLTWNDFRETFIGIAPTKFLSANFDPIFYDNIYQTKLAGPGNCFGMCLLALEMKKNGGCEGFCYPPYLYPGQTDSPGGPAQPELSQLSHAINIVHGHQINHRAIMYMLDIIAQNKQRDGNYVFDQLQYYLSKDDPCIVSVTTYWTPGSDGHALIAYKATVENSIRKIYIYDPNRSYYGPGGTDYYDNLHNYIEIDPNSGTWKFKMASDSVWSGSPSDGGNLILFPLSVVGPRDRIPQSLFADISEAISKILIYGSGVDVNQISNVKGRHLFKPGTKELETDTSKSIKNLLPFVSLANSTQNNDEKQMMFFYRSNEPLDIDVKNSGHGYNVTMIGLKGFVSVKAVNGSGNERIRMEYLNSSTPAVTFTNQTNSSYYQVELRSFKKENEKIQVYSIDKFNPEVNAPVKIMISKKGSGIEMVSAKRISQFELTVSETGKEKINPVKQLITLDPGKIVKYSLEKSRDKKELKLNMIK